MKIFASNFRDRLTIDHCRKNTKLGQKGSGSGHMTYFLNFETLPYWSTSNLACIQNARGTNEKKYKIRSKEVRKGSRDLLLKFGTPSISRERLELETSNLACRLTTRVTNERNAKLGQSGS